jgi:hypothetical protein
VKLFKVLIASMKQDVNVKQVSIVMLLFLIMVSIFVFKSEGYQKAFGKGYREQFHQSFKQSFSETCYGQNASEEIIRRCDCILEKMQNELSLHQLKQETIVRKYVEDRMISECQ